MNKLLSTNFRSKLYNQGLLVGWLVGLGCCLMWVYLEGGMAYKRGTISP